MGKKRTHEEYVAEVAIKNPDVEVLEQFQGTAKKILHRYKKCGHQRLVSPNIILQGCGCYQCMINNRLRTHDKFVNSDKMKKSNWAADSEYTGHRNPLWLKCKKCGYRKFAQPSNKVLDAPCPECEGKKSVIYTVGDLKTLRPDIAAMMEDQELAGKIGVYSKQDVWFICPFCGERICNKPANVARHGLSCPSCSGGRKYPNRLMYNVLKHILDEFEPEYMKPWTDNRKYDFMFEMSQNKYLIEMDGGQHKTGFPGGLTKEQNQENDAYKDRLAIENGFHIIRIDCDYPPGQRFQYIKNNILNSELAIILDFSNTDWEYADLISQPSDFQQICKMYDSGVHDVDVIAKEIGLCAATVIQHLIHSEEIGCSTYKHSDGLYERNELRKQRLSSANGCCLLCVETNEIFPSIATAKRYYGGNIDRYLAGKVDCAGVLPDGQKIHYRRIDKSDIDYFVTEENCVLMDVNFQRDHINKNRRHWKNTIRCNETGEYIISISLANKIYHTSIGHYFADNYDYAGKLSDGTKLTWSRTTIDEVLSYIENGGVVIEHFNNTK